MPDRLTSLRSALGSVVVDLDAVRAAKQRLAAVPAHDAEAAIEHAAVLREQRRASRTRRRGGVRRQPTCQGCRLFVSNPAIACPHCGYWPGRGWVA